MADGAAEAPRRAKKPRGLPHNWDMERSLLGGCLLDPGQVVELAEIVREEDFARGQHRAVWGVLVAGARKGRAVDLPGLLDEIEQRGSFDPFGGAAYVVALPSACTSVDHLLQYARRVRDLADRRRLLLALQEQVDLVTEAIPKRGDEVLPTPSELCDQVQAAVQVVRDGSSREATWTTLPPVVRSVASQVEAAHANPGRIRGVSTGLVDLDAMIGGLEPGRMYVIAAAPGMGKTSLALGIAGGAASRNHRVGIFSMEMGREQLTAQMIGMSARVEVRKMMEGRGGEEEIRRWQDAADRVAALPIVIDDEASLPIGEIRSRARAMQRSGGLDLMIVDYLQLATCPEARRGGREQEVSAVSHGLLAVAKSLNIPLIALAQLNRKVADRADKRPLPSDLRESGAIEQDAHLLLFIYRDEVYNRESADRGIAECIIPKNRSGATGTVKLGFTPQWTLFRNLAAPAPPGTDRGGYY